jgi:hypothetical protein
MKANLIQVRNNPKEWYDEDNEKYREILEENDIAIDFNLNNENFTVTLNKSTFEKIKNKEIIINLQEDNKNE